MNKWPYSNARTFKSYNVISATCLFLAILAGAFTYLSPRFSLLPSYIFFFSFAAFSVMFFQTILTKAPSDLRNLDLKEQRGILIAAIVVSMLCVFSELSLIAWPKIPAGLLLGCTVLYHGYRVWQGFTLGQIWHNVALRFYITDMFFLLVAAIGLFALGWKETWPDFPIIPAFLRPSTVFLGASFPLTLTFTGFLYQFANQNGGLSTREHMIFEGWYYLLVGGVLAFLLFILLNLRSWMLISAITLACGVFAINLLFVRRLAQSPRSVHLLFAVAGLAGLLATSSAGTALILSNTPTMPAGKNPILLSHIHLAQLGWVCISFWGILYTLWPTINSLESKQISLLPLGTDYAPAARNLAYLQLILAIGAIILLVASHMGHNLGLMRCSGILYATTALLPIPIMSLATHNAVPA